MSEFKQKLGEISREKRLYTLETLPRHLVESGQGEKLHQLLTDFDFIEAKRDEWGVQALIEDYDLAIILICCVGRIKVEMSNLFNTQFAS